MVHWSNRLRFRLYRLTTSCLPIVQPGIADLVGAVRSVVPGLVSSSASIVLTTKLVTTYSNAGSMSDGSSMYALGTFAKAVGHHTAIGIENSVVVFGLSVT